MSIIAENVAAVRANIVKAARRAGRDAKEISLLAASKTQDIAAALEAAAAGVDVLGENRAQEFRDKAPLLGGFPCHFIGRLQRNKLKYLVGYTPLIHSVDSLPLLETIDTLAKSRALRQDILIEVNIGGEASKGGVAPKDLPSWLKTAGTFDNVRVCGLMCVPPRAENERLKSIFCEMRKLFVDIRNENMDNVCMNVLSMGMSEDYPLAVEHGSTLVRVGSAIFGARLRPQTTLAEGDSHEIER